ncbi:MAG: carotenoid oxygenase family protein [Microthrixaceae bacterium]
MGVMPRSGDGSDTTWIDVDPFYVFHFMNAWEDPFGRVVVDGCRAEAMPTAFGDDPLPDASVRPYLWRWEIDLATGTAKDRQLDDRPGDFPRINDSMTGRANRFGTQGHTRDWSDDGVEFDGVIQFDHGSGSSDEYLYGPTKVCGEAVFAADPAGDGERDGWLLNFVTDLEDDSSEFVVLDARTSQRGPSPGCHCPAASRSVSTGTGCPTPSESTSRRADSGPAPCSDGASGWTAADDDPGPRPTGTDAIEPVGASLGDHRQRSRIRGRPRGPGRWRPTLDLL